MDVKHGRTEATHYHPIIDEITKHTQYQIVYQEQILQVVRLVGGFSWEEAARIRKIISKKRGEQEFRRQGDKFTQGAKEHGMSKEEAERVFNLLATAGAYAFNAAHCVSYGMLAYWTMWLKRNHPTPFYVASLTKCGGDKKGKERQGQLLRDAKRHGVEVAKIHLNRSGANWTIDGSRIRPGFQQVKGIAGAMSGLLLREREAMGGFNGWDDLIKIKGVGPAKRDAIRKFYEDEDPFELDLLSKTVAKVREQLERGELADEHGLLPVPTHRSIDVPYERSDESKMPVVWLGVVRSINLKDLFENHYSRTGEQLDPKSIKQPELDEWVVMQGEDDTEPIVVTVDRYRYQQWKEDVWSIDVGHDLVLVKGWKYGVQARRAIYVSKMWVLDPSDDPDPEEEEESDGQD
jgi:DNA polymerase-3 subunit alpha